MNIIFDNIKRVEIIPDKINKYKTESEFMDLSVELFKEIGLIILTLANIIKRDDNNKLIKWNKNEAIIVGNLIRINKLQNSFLDNICQKRREITVILSRCLAETIINLLYILKNIKNSKVYTEFIEYSMREEKELLIKIDENVKKRGSELPIEKRMRNSILSSLNQSGLKIEDIKKSIGKSWTTSLYKKAKEVELLDIFYAIYSLPTHAVHGNWQDLIDYHINFKENGYEPNSKWHIPRPQQITGVGYLSVLVCKKYAKTFLTFMNFNEIKNILEDIEKRLFTLDKLHESFIQKQTNK